MAKWDLISFVSRSKHRKKVLKALEDSPMTPTKLSEKIQTQKSSTSRTLNELEAKNLIKKLTEARKGRYYAITDKGKEILEKVENLK